MSETNETHHHEGYRVYAITAIVLLALTALNIFIAGLSHSVIISGIIIFISMVQAFIALTWFMHLRYDNMLFKSLVIGVFFLYAVVIVITFFDYLFR